MRSITIILQASLILFLFSSPTGAATIAADALVDFRVDGYAPLGNGPYTTHVSAWHNTGIWLEPGDLFALEATGTIWVAPPFTPERGEGPDPRGLGICTACVAELPDSIAALVGKIGEDLGDEFVVGSSFSGVANDSGYLFLAFNDNHYSDNAGFFLVNTTAVPEPSTLTLSCSLASVCSERVEPEAAAQQDAAEAAATARPAQPLKRLLTPTTSAELWLSLSVPSDQR